LQLSITNPVITNSILIYPNPNQGVLNISYPGKTGMKVHLRNNLGQTLLSKPITEGEQLNLSAYPKGLFFLELQTGEAIEVKKIILK